MEIQVTDEDIEDYTNGACWVLTEVIHELTGWPRVIAEAMFGFQTHTMIAVPDGRYLDVEGLQDGSYWTSIDDIPQDEDLAVDHDWRFGWEDRYWERARLIAPQLIALAERAA